MKDENQKCLTLPQRMISASTGAIITSLIVTPFEVVKTRLQTQSSSITIHDSSRKRNSQCGKFSLLKNKLTVSNSPIQFLKRARSNTSLTCKRYCANRFTNLNIFYPNFGKTCLTSFVRLRCSVCVRKETKSLSFLKPLSLTAKSNQLNGTLHGLRTILYKEGLKGLYVGLKPTLMMAIPSNVLYFSTYDIFKLYLQSNTELDNFTIAFTAGTTGRTLAAFAIAPLELLRTRLQAQTTIKNNGSIFKQVQEIIMKEGLRGIYRGFTPTLLRDVPFSSVYWVLIESIKPKLVGYSTSEKAMISGALSGMVATFFTMPFDVIKTRTQILKKDKKTLRQVSKLIYKQEGIKGFFAGLFPRTAKVAPACAIMLSSYEVGKQFFLTNETIC